MYIEKNTNNNIVFYQSPSKRNCWGFVDQYGDYISERDFKKGQIFYLYKNSMALQLEIIEFMEKTKGNVRIRVKNYEKEDFWAIVSARDFRRLAKDEFGTNAIFSYDKMNYKKYGLQIRLPMHCFTRKYDNQGTL